jgi:hypothetical protein
MHVPPDHSRSGCMICAAERHRLSGIAVFECPSEPLVDGRSVDMRCFNPWEGVGQRIGLI